MYIPDKQYTPNASDLNELEEEKLREEEMEKAFLRMEKSKRRPLRRKKAVRCANGTRREVPEAVHWVRRVVLFAHITAF